MKHSKKEEAQTLPGRATGRISTTGKGLGFVSIPHYEEDIEIPAGFLNTALNGDEVEIKLHPKRKNRRLAGEVIRVIKRARESFVGIIDKNERGICYVIPDDRKMYVDIIVPPEEAKNLKNGQKVQVKIASWQTHKKNPEGAIMRVLGEKGNNNVEMESIVLEKGFDWSYPDSVEHEAHEVGKKLKNITSEEIAKRRDFRNTDTFTIDPEDAKDFDDAISFKKLPNGHFEIGVHIADVSHYVEEGTALDKEALKRSFSVYLVDRTIPMLPEVLSNDLCSLNPHEDKLAFSAVFDMDMNGKIYKRWFGKTIINSNKRFTYENAQATLDAKSGEYFEELNTLNIIAKKLQLEKFHAGAIDFEQDEIRFKLDENGKPIGVYKKKRMDTHKLVEEYMLLANREVAKFIADSIENKKQGGIASIYRIHDIPDKDKVIDLSIFIKALGYDLPIRKNTVSSKDLNALLKQVEGKAEESIVKTAAIRSMAKAIYSVQNVGHFGLAFKFYTHFTSPIRRYPDLVIHRILHNHLHGEKISDKEFAKYKHIAAQASDREIAAAEAERASRKYKQVEYMMDKVGQEFDGIITGVTEWGIYVEEAETKCEGMVKLSTLADDFYELNEKTYSIHGQKTKKKYSLGDKIRFKVAGANLEKKTLDYTLA